MSNIHTAEKQAFAGYGRIGGWVLGLETIRVGTKLGPG